MPGAGLARALAVARERALDGGGEESGEQRVRAVRPRAELRVELRADHPGVVANLADLDERAVRGRAAGDEAGLFELGAVLVVELVAVAVALGHLGGLVGAMGARAGDEPTVVFAEPHRPALVDDPALGVEERDDGIRRLGVELGGVRLVAAEVVAGELDGHDMQAEAEPEVGDAAGAGEAGGLDLALDAALTEAAGHDDAVDVGEELVRATALDV